MKTRNRKLKTRRNRRRRQHGGLFEKYTVGSFIVANSILTVMNEDYNRIMNYNVGNTAAGNVTPLEMTRIFLRNAVSHIIMNRSSYMSFEQNSSKETLDHLKQIPLMSIAALQSFPFFTTSIAAAFHQRTIAKTVITDIAPSGSVPDDSLVTVVLEIFKFTLTNQCDLKTTGELLSSLLYIKLLLTEMHHAVVLAFELYEILGKQRLANQILPGKTWTVAELSSYLDAILKNKTVCYGSAAVAIVLQTFGLILKNTPIGSGISLVGNAISKLSGYMTQAKSIHFVLPTAENIKSIGDFRDLIVNILDIQESVVEAVIGYSVFVGDYKHEDFVNISLYSKSATLTKHLIAKIIAKEVIILKESDKAQYKEGINAKDWQQVEDCLRNLDKPSFWENIQGLYNQSVIASELEMGVYDEADEERKAKENRNKKMQEIISKIQKGEDIPLHIMNFMVPDMSKSELEIIKNFKILNIKSRKNPFEMKRSKSRLRPLGRPGPKVPTRMPQTVPVEEPLDEFYEPLTQEEIEAVNDSNEATLIERNDELKSQLPKKEQESIENAGTYKSVYEKISEKLQSVFEVTQSVLLPDKGGTRKYKRKRTRR
jgi:hypothetical protein